MRRFVLVTALAVTALAACGPAPAPQPVVHAEPQPASDPESRRLEAQVHFKAGMKKVEDKDYDGGIAELELAQRILPHPYTLFNLAKANEDAGHTAEAIRYYKLYLAQNPSDRAEVEATVARLEGH